MESFYDWFKHHGCWVECGGWKDEDALFSSSWQWKKKENRCYSVQVKRVTLDFFLNFKKRKNYADFFLFIDLRKVKIFFDKKNHKKKKDLAVFGLRKNSSQKYYFTKNSGYDSSFKELYFESKIIKKYFWEEFFQRPNTADFWDREITCTEHDCNFRCRTRTQDGSTNHSNTCTLHLYIFN